MKETGDAVILEGGSGGARQTYSHISYSLDFLASTWAGE